MISNEKIISELVFSSVSLIEQLKIKLSTKEINCIMIDIII